jgi:hypothetical protein
MHTEEEDGLFRSIVVVDWEAAEQAEAHAVQELHFEFGQHRTQQRQWKVLLHELQHVLLQRFEVCNGSIAFLDVVGAELVNPLLGLLLQCLTVPRSNAFNSVWPRFQFHDQNAANPTEQDFVNGFWHVLVNYLGNTSFDKEARISILRKFSNRFSHSFRKLFHSSMEKEKDEFPRLDKSQFFKREKVLVLTVPVLKVSENVNRLKKVCLFYS